MATSDWKDVATLLGVGLAAVGLAYTAYNTRLTQRTNRARFWLDLRSQFARHDEVHRKLRRGGAWTEGGEPKTESDWADLESYMGLFEHCELMMKQGLLDESTFRRIYFYRLGNIVANETIRREKLEKRASSWTAFIELLDRMGIEYKSRK